MSASPALIAAWARSAIAPYGGAFRALEPYALAAPVLAALLQRAGIRAEAVDAVVLGNALGAGGNPARMLALAAGLAPHCATFSVDTQCCSGLDAVALGVGLLASGQASVVVAGGVEAWSRAPLRQHRPLQAGAPAVPYERPAFAPPPLPDPDLLQSAADYAARHGITRAEQDAYAVHSHHQALAQQTQLADEIVTVAGLQHDAYPRALSAERAARMPVAARAAQSAGLGAADCALSSLAISAKADGAALLLLATPQACQALGMRPRAAWVASSTRGDDPATPLLAAEQTTRAVLGLLQAGGLTPSGQPGMEALCAIELHDAFAVQALSYCRGLGLPPERINRRGGGLARGHPIGASGAVALVRVLADLQRDEAPGALGLAAIAGAGGVGAAALVRRL